MCSDRLYDKFITQHSNKKPPEGGFDLPESLYTKEGLLEAILSDRRH